MITLVDYGVGNLAAVVNMLRHIGVPCRRTGDPAVIDQAERVILPGVGHFDHCYRQLVAQGLRDVLDDLATVRKVPLLGICVGSQLLGHGSEEGESPGLGWLDLDVVRLPANQGRRIPRMGWGEVISTRPNPLIDDPRPRPPRFYFAHSYFMRPRDETLTVGLTSYGVDYAASVQRDNILGVQFHPEKSHHYGMDVLRRFAEWTP